MADLECHVAQKSQPWIAKEAESFALNTSCWKDRKAHLWESIFVILQAPVVLLRQEDLDSEYQFPGLVKALTT
jgi:hypothetical protein